MISQPLRYPPLIEALVFSAFVGLYIWQLQEAYRLSWIVFVVWLVASFLLHKDTPKSLGWRADNLWSSIQQSAKVLLPCALALVVIGLLLGATHRSSASLLAPRHFFGYMSFCLLQQIGLNSMVSNRLLAATGSPLWTSMLVGALFGLLHWPNPVLVPITAVGGALMSWLFCRERNILSLTVWQAILGTLVWWAFPLAWHHAMRVGPGFYRFHLH
jgi:hypothetical protein